MSPVNLKDATLRLNAKASELQPSQNEVSPSSLTGQNTTQKTSEPRTKTKSNITKGQFSLKKAKEKPLIVDQADIHRKLRQLMELDKEVERSNVETDDNNNNKKGNDGQETTPVITDGNRHHEENQKNRTIGRMERDFCNYFGATPTLPKIKKNLPRTPANSQSMIEPTVNEKLGRTEEERLGKLKEVYTRLEEIEKLKLESQKLLESFKAEKNKAKEPTNEPAEQGKEKTEGGLIFDFTKTPDSNSFGLPAYFHKNMQSLQGILPLTIFNRSWQQAASDNHIDYRKQDKETEKYKGHPYPGEWTQSRFEWNENFDSFVSSCRDSYKYVAFADALEIHKKNVITIFKQQQSWVIAFRYDLTIRKATFAIRNPGESIPNPALEPSGLLDEIYYAARSQNDLNTEDNPYRKGGPKFGRNPYSDIITEPTTYNANYQIGQRQNAPRYNNGKINNRSQTPYGNYKGKRFNPNYKRTETNGGESEKKGADKKV